MKCEGGGGSIRAAVVVVVSCGRREGACITLRSPLSLPRLSPCSFTCWDCAALTFFSPSRQAKSGPQAVTACHYVLLAAFSALNMLRFIFDCGSGFVSEGFVFTEGSIFDCSSNIVSAGIVFAEGVGIYFWLWPEYCVWRLFFLCYRYFNCMFCMLVHMRSRVYVVTIAVGLLF